MFGVSTNKNGKLGILYYFLAAIVSGVILWGTVDILLMFQYDSFGINSKTIFKIVVTLWQLIALFNFFAIHSAARKVARFSEFISKISLPELKTSWNQRPRYMTAYIWGIIIFVIVISLFNAVLFVVHDMKLYELPVQIGLYRENVTGMWPLVFLNNYCASGLNFLGVAFQTVMIQIVYLSYKCFAIHFSKSQLSFTSIVYFQQQLQATKATNKYLNSIWAPFNFGLCTFLVIIIISILSVLAIDNTIDSSQKFNFVLWILLNAMIMMMLVVPTVLLNENKDGLHDVLVDAVVEAKRGQKNPPDNHNNESMTEEQKTYNEMDFLLKMAEKNNAWMTAGNVFVFTRMTMMTTVSLLMTYFILVLQMAEKPAKS